MLIQPVRRRDTLAVLAMERERGPSLPASVELPCPIISEPVPVVA
jgi:hypothetical protein